MNSFTGESFANEAAASAEAYTDAAVDGVLTRTGENVSITIDGGVKLAAYTAADAITNDGDVRVRKRLRTESIAMRPDAGDTPHVDWYPTAVALTDPAADTYRFYVQQSDGQLRQRFSSGTDVAVAEFTTQHTGFTVDSSSTGSATYAWDTRADQVKHIVLDQDSTMSAPTNMVRGYKYTLVLQQDATGTRTVTWNQVFRWPGNAEPVLSEAPNRIDIFTFLAVDDTYLVNVASSLGNNTTPIEANDTPLTNPSAPAGWSALASSVQNASTDAYKAFDKQTTAWSCLPGNYSAIDGTYTNNIPASTPYALGSGTYNGEWVQLTFPSATHVDGFRYLTSALDAYPIKCRIFGKNVADTDWVQLFTTENYKALSPGNNTSIETSTYIPLDTTGSFEMFRMATNTIFPRSGGNAVCRDLYLYTL